MTKAWFAVVEAERQVQLASDTVDSRRTTAERIGARYRRGVGCVPGMEIDAGGRTQFDSAPSR